MNNPNSVEGTGGKPELYPEPPKELPETEDDGFATVYPCEENASVERISGGGERENSAFYEAGL